MNRCEIEREIEREIIAQVRAELAGDDPTLSRLVRVSFISRSKGRNRQRRNWQEIELICDTARPERPLAYRLARCVAWDDIAKEIYPCLDGYSAERRVRKVLGVQTV